MDKFWTISEKTSGEYKEKGSKFLAFAYPVQSEEGIKKELHTLKKTFHDARHHCYAFILGTDDQQIRANDDGEPNHSAGDPILGQLKSAEVTNCLVVVVRYFGGTKLGVPGLINAYKTAAMYALSKARRVEIIEMIPHVLEFEYDQMGLVERWMEDFGCQVEKRDYRTKCRLSLKVEKSLNGQFVQTVSQNHLVKMIENE